MTVLTIWMKQSQQRDVNKKTGIETESKMTS